MVFYYRKSVSLCPFRVNLSKPGVGYSVGGRGFRIGTTTRGRNCTSFSGNLNCTVVIGEVLENFEAQKK